MTGQEIFDLTTELLGGIQIGDTLFYQLLNAAKKRRESMRPWMILRAIDSSKTASASDGITNTKALPTRFLRTWSSRRKNGIQSPVLLKSGSSVRYVQQIPFGTQHESEDDADKFFVDLAGGTFAFTGTRDQSYTVYLNYIRESTDFTTVGTETWAFPENYGLILAHDVAMTQKGDIDYDDVNARMVRNHTVSAEQLWQAMCMWDGELQRADTGV